MSNVIAGVRLPANAVVLVRGHLERFSLARSESEVHFIQAEVVGMLMMLERLQRLSHPNAMTLARHVQGLASERVVALGRLAALGAAEPDQLRVE